MTHDPTPIRSRDLQAMLAGRRDREALQELWETLPRVAPAPCDPTADERQEAWRRLRATITDRTRRPYTADVPAPLALLEEERPAAPRTLEAARRVPRWMVAASAAAVLVSATAALRAVPVTHYAPTTVGASPVMTIRLADGSDVWLTAGSSLSVPRALGWPGVLRATSRDVRLTGRGFFVVQKDGRPFVVRTADAAVRVLGTRFEVQTERTAGKQSAGTQISVQEGRVAVSLTAPSAESVELGAGQRITTTAGILSASSVRSVAAERVGAWRTGGFSALDETLDAVLVELARRYGIEVTHASDVDGSATVSLFYPDAPTADVVLSDLCTAQGLTLHRTSRGYHITRSGDQP